MFKKLLLAVVFAAPVVAMEKKQVSFKEEAAQPTSPVVRLRKPMPDAKQIKRISQYQDGLVEIYGKQDEPLALTPLNKNYRSSEHKSQVLGLIAKYEQMALGFVTTQGLTPIKSHVPGEELPVMVSPNSFDAMKKKDQKDRRKADAFVKVIAMDEEETEGMISALSVKKISNNQ